MGKAVKNSQNLVNVVYGCTLLGKNATLHQLYTEIAIGNTFSNVEADDS